LMSANKAVAKVRPAMARSALADSDARHLGCRYMPKAVYDRVGGKTRKMGSNMDESSQRWRPRGCLA
ncbi:MAG: hypothetical protein ACYCUJ_08495, partial [Acidithiobacillus sp.]